MVISSAREPIRRSHQWKQRGGESSGHARPGAGDVRRGSGKAQRLLYGGARHRNVPGCRRCNSR